MTPYLAFLSLPALMSLFGTSGQTRLLRPFFFAVMVVFIGLRQKVGMDWNNYYYLVAKARTQSFAELFFSAEPLSGALLKFASTYQQEGIFVLNFIAAVIFATGLFAICFRQNNPWQALACSIPYLAVVIGMSGVRQAIALGIVFLLVAYWPRLRTWQKVALIGLCTSFHFSGIAMFAFLFYEQRNDMVKFGLLGSLILVIFVVLGVGGDRFSFYYEAYIADHSGRVESPGALMHVLVVAAPAIAYLIWRNKDWGMPVTVRRIMDLAAVLSVAALPFVLIYSTATDRLTLYLSFVPVLFYGNVERLMTAREDRVLLNFALIALNTAILMVWLKYANSAIAWIPYGNYLFR